MEIIQEIGAYAGLAAVVGLAVLSALYFSQARDVRRLREWAGRAPERAPDSAAGTQPARVTPQPRRAGPIRPGQPVRPGQAPARQGQAAARPAQTGAGPAAAVGGAAAGGAAAGAAAGAAGPSSPAARSAAGGTEAPPADADLPAGDDDEPGTGDEEALEAAGDDDATEVAPPPGDGVPAEGDTGEEDELPEDDEYLDDEEDADEDLEPAAPVNGAPDGEGASPAVPPTKPAPPTLPPRPASRLPARAAPPPRTAGGHTEVIPPSEHRAPWYRRDPRLAVLAVAGVLIVGGAAVFGLTKIGENGNESQQRAAQNAGNDSGSDKPATKRKAARVSPSSVTVSILNGTNVPGLAAQIGDEVEAKGFQLGNVTNASDQGVRNESVVFFAGGAEREAIAVGRALDISQREGIDARTQSLAGDARVVVVAGSDKTK